MSPQQQRFISGGQGGRGGRGIRCRLHKHSCHSTVCALTCSPNGLTAEADRGPPGANGQDGQS